MKTAAYYICCAQAYSDAAKNIHSELSDIVVDRKVHNDYNGYVSSRDFYNKKDTCLLMAIRVINKNKKDLNPLGFRYYVTRDREVGRYGSYLVYFYTKYNGEKIQISFHCFNGALRKYLGHYERKCSWDKSLGGSRNACLRVMGFEEWD